MRVATWLPFRSRKERERIESAGYMAEALKLCGKPRACPTSWATTYSTMAPMMESGMGNCWARGSSGAGLHEVPVPRGGS
jgi:hypothetical protein